MRLRSESQQVSTEDLREALLRYRSLFDELLRPEGNGAADGTIGEEQPADVGSRQRVSDGPELQDPDPDYNNQRIGRPEGR